jgi:hypothetical protein
MLDDVEGSGAGLVKQQALENFKFEVRQERLLLMAW